MIKNTSKWSYTGIVKHTRTLFVAAVVIVHDLDAVCPLEAHDGGIEIVRQAAVFEAL